MNHSGEFSLLAFCPHPPAAVTGAPDLTRPRPACGKPTPAAGCCRARVLAADRNRPQPPAYLQTVWGYATSFVLTGSPRKPLTMRVLFRPVALWRDGVFFWGGWAFSLLVLNPAGARYSAMPKCSEMGPRCSTAPLRVGLGTFPPLAVSQLTVVCSWVWAIHQL